MSETPSGDFEPVVPETGRGAAEWVLRPWLLAALFGAAGLLIHVVTDGHDDVPWRAALAAFLLFGAIAAGFTLEQGRWKAPSLFALLIGLVMAGLAWRAVRYGDSLPDEEYGLAAGVVASALALPLFQAEFHRRRLATPYAEIYGHVWTDAICAAGALAFTGLSWIVLALLSELFVLLKIEFLRDAMNEGWFGWTFSGLAAGAALGTLRNQLKILATMQTVVLLVASLLAVPLAFGLVVFLLATAVSGPQVLWDATRSATPLLLACAAAAFVLANAIARQSDEAMSRSRMMRGAALVLAAVILPLAVFAAFSLGLRLDQYGLAPERLWGLVAIVVACVCGVGYWVVLARGRRGGWAEHLRTATFHLALFVCGLAVLLALPILDFGAISTRNQLARLEKGEVTAEDFDYDALRWDFGNSGRAALRRFASGRGIAAELAQNALDRERRVYRGFESDTPFRDRIANLRSSIDDPELVSALRAVVLNGPAICQQVCTAIDVGSDQNGKPHVVLVEGKGLTHFQLEADGHLEMIFPEMDASLEELGGQVEKPTDPANPKVEVRTIQARQVFVDGEAIGKPFE